MNNIVVLGHKDHGKSTFLGKLLFETNSVPADKVATVKEIDAEAGREFEWAHLLDSFKEEREQEMTYDTASVFVQGKRGTYIFIDVPGHAELVHQMLSGASKADSALLVVSAKEGIDVMSVKHLALAGFLGIKNLIVAINKMDAVGYEEKTFQQMKEKIETEISKTKFVSERVFFVPVSAREGDNVSLKSARMPWFAGENVFEKIEENFSAFRAVPSVFRGLVQDVYEHQGKPMAMVVVKNGMFERGARIKSMPRGTVFSAQELFSVSREQILSAGSNENVGIFVEPEWEISRGAVLSPERDAPAFTAHASSEIFLFREVNAAEPVFIECGGMRARHIGARSFASGEIRTVELKLDASLLFDRNETFLNRFVVKQSGEIIGAGRIVKI